MGPLSLSLLHLVPPPPPRRPRSPTPFTFPLVAVAALPPPPSHPMVEPPPRPAASISLYLPASYLSRFVVLLFRSNNLQAPLRPTPIPSWRSHSAHSVRPITDFGSL